MRDSKKASSVHRLFVSNNPPSAANLKRVLHNIDALQEKIEVAEGRISYWTSRLSNLKERLNQQLGVASPLRRMPAEILGQIFLAYPYDVSTSLPTMTRPGRQELVNLMLVCRSWRAAALSAHKLWSAIQIDGVDAPRMSYDKAIAWFTRAGGVPRTLMLSMDRTEDCPSLCTSEFTFAPPCAMRRTLALIKLLTEGPPLQTLGIEVRHRRCLDNFAKLLDKHKHSNQFQETLRRLHLTVQSTEEDSDYQFLSSFLTIPSIHLAGPGGAAPLAASGSCLEHLTSLSFGQGGEWHGAILATLSKCKNLNELSIFIPAGLDLLVTPPKYVVCLLKVTALRIVLEVSDDPVPQAASASILDHLHLPALTTLEVTNAWLATDASTWNDFFQKHSSIRSFKCRGTTGAPLQAAFTHLRFLTHLAVGGENTAIAWLVSRMRRSVIQKEDWLPCLEHLEMLEVGDQVDLHARDIFDFPRSRAKGRKARPDGSEVAIMKSLTVNFLAQEEGPSLTSRVEKLLRSYDITVLRKEGMNVTIGSYRETGVSTKRQPRKNFTLSSS